MHHSYSIIHRFRVSGERTERLSLLDATVRDILQRVLSALPCRRSTDTVMSEKKTILNLQALRAVAALLVLLSHVMILEQKYAPAMPCSPHVLFRWQWG